MPALAAATLSALLAPPALGFPPYRSTDAETADPWGLELRVGVAKIKREADETTLTSPLLRANFGLPHNVEILSEFEYRPSKSHLDEAAIGTKWVPWMGASSFGVEALALLPVSSEGGAGTEVSLLATHRGGGWRAHLNAGGFYDARGTSLDRGWKASVLAELPLDGLRPGVEVAAEQLVSEPMELQLGVGAVVDAGEVDLRAGVHAGLTPDAVDVVGSFWVTGKLALPNVRAKAAD